MKTRQLKTKRPSTHEGAATAGKGSSATTLTWTATIAHTRHRWWWYPVILWVGLVLTLWAVEASNWSAAVVAIVTALALVIVNVGRPRTWKVTLKKGTIHIERPGYRRFRYEVPLSRYRAFTVIDLAAGNRDVHQRAIALIPNQRIAGVQLLVLPTDEITADMLIQQFSDYLPYEAGAAFSSIDRAISAIARWIGIS